MIVEKISAEKRTQYCEFIGKQKEALFYHSLPYLDYLCELLECTNETLLVMYNNEIVSALPLLSKNGYYGQVYNSLPYYGSHGGILGLNKPEIIDMIKSELECLNYAALTIIDSPWSNHVGQFNYPHVDTRISQMTPLITEEEPEKYILETIDSSTRRNIRKAHKSDVKVRIDNQAIDYLYATHIDNMARISGKNKSENSFELIAKYFKADKDYKIYVAEKDDQVIAALLIFYFNHVAEYFTPVITETYRTYQPLSAIIYRAMLDAIQSGCHYWNWGGTWLTQDGVYRFKRKWGATERKYKYYTAMNNHSLLNANRDLLAEQYPNFYLYNYELNHLVETV